MSCSLLPLPLFLGQVNPTNTQILQHFLGKRIKHAPAALDDAVLVGLDVEWFEAGDKEVTELGISHIDPRNAAPNAGPWDVLKTMETLHVRIMETAHMVNTKLCPGRPDKFQFGQTRFVHKEDIPSILRHAFCTPKADGNGYRPVIFVGHAVDNDIEMMNHHFGIDLRALGTIVATLDTQTMAKEAGIPGRGPQIKLRDLIEHLGLREEFLHTAGNDIAYTMIAAFLTTWLTLTNQAPELWPPLQMWQQPVQLERLKVSSRMAQQPNVGVSIFCVRCDSMGHMEEQCDAKVHCEKCATRKNGLQNAHKTEKCCVVEQSQQSQAARNYGVVIPCEGCTMSTDPKRWTKAGTHLTNDCLFQGSKT